MSCIDTAQLLAVLHPAIIGVLPKSVAPMQGVSLSLTALQVVPAKALRAMFVRSGLLLLEILLLTKI